MSGYARAIALVLAMTLLLGGCSTPIGVRRLDPREAYRSSTASPLGGDGASSATIVILHRFNLTAEYQTDPAAAIRTLHARTLEDNRRDIVFARA
jgi:hypothetical protein